MFAVGLFGVGVLVLVQVLGGHGKQQPEALRQSRDRHRARAAALPSAPSSGIGVAASQRTERAWASLWRSRPLLPLVERVVVPVAFVSSAAAAGVHAAVGPLHFRESALFGLFFAASAMLQLLWAGALMAHRTKGLLLAGALGNLAVVAMWVVTRTVGLPLGLLPEPEAVGPWDLASVVWGLAVAGSCVVILRSPGTGSALAPWRDWERSVRLYAVGSVLLLVALTFSGAAA